MRRRRAAAHMLVPLLLVGCGGLAIERPAPLVALRGVPLVYLVESGDADVVRIATAVAQRITASAVHVQHTSETQLASESAAGFVPAGALVVSLQLEVARRTAVDWPQHNETPSGMPAWHVAPPPVVTETPVLVVTLTFVARDATTGRELTRTALVHQDDSPAGDDAMREAALTDLVARAPALFAPQHP